MLVVYPVAPGQLGRALSPIYLSAGAVGEASRAEPAAAAAGDDAAAPTAAIQGGARGAASCRLAGPPGRGTCCE